MAKSAIDKRRTIRAAEHKRDMLLQKQEATRNDLAKARLALAQTRRQK